MLALWKAFWRYRYFVVSSIRNDLINRFATSKLGGLWMLLNPLAMVLIYSLVLSNILAARLPGVEGKYAYAMYLMAGIAGWTLFSELVTRCLNLFLENANLLKKISFPRITLPAIVSGSCLVNNLILLLAVLVIGLILGQSFSFALLWLLPLILLTILLGLGLGLILGIYNVFVRDIGQVVPIILQLGFWFTPIVYPVDILPETFQNLIRFNPLFYVVSGYQRVLLYNEPPLIGEGLIILTIISLPFLLLSLFIFRRASPEMVDVL